MVKSRFHCAMLGSCDRLTYGTPRISISAHAFVSISSAPHHPSVVGRTLIQKSLPPPREPPCSSSCQAEKWKKSSSYSSVTRVDTRQVHLADKGDLRRLVRVVLAAADLEAVDAVLVDRVGWAEDSAVPVCHADVVAFVQAVGTGLCWCCSAVCHLL